MNALTAEGIEPSTLVRDNKPNLPRSRSAVVDDVTVYAGYAPQAPEDIRRALGSLDTSNEAAAIHKLIGTVMSLCWTVQVLELEIEKLKGVQS